MSGRRAQMLVAVAATVLMGSVLTGAAGASVPAGATGNPQITIKAIDREGNLVPVTASLQDPGKFPGGIDDTLTSAHATRVPPGTYNIAAWIYEPGGSGQTLVDRELTVKAAGTVTFDARQGHRILFTVDDPTVAPDAVNGVFAEPYMPHGWKAFDGQTSDQVGPVYAVPGTMAAGFSLSLEAVLVRPHEAFSPPVYVLLRQLKGKIPANLTFAVSKAGLASDHVTVKANDPGLQGGVGFEPVAEGTLGDVPLNPVDLEGFPPFSDEFHVTPGYDWHSGTDSANVGNLPMLSARNYTQTFDNASWGPSPQWGPSVTGNQLQARAVAMASSELFVDPTQDVNAQGSAGWSVSSGQTWIYEGTKLIAHSLNRPGTLSATISATPHWYTVRAQANRAGSPTMAGPRPTLWKTEIVSFHFKTQANGHPHVFWPRIIPSGLSVRNSAPHGTKTKVRIYFTGAAGDLPAHGVLVWASMNGGKTWQALHVGQSGPHWTVTVTNPGTPGYVSLRVQGTDAAGDSASVLTINAYAVS